MSILSPRGTFAFPVPVASPDPSDPTLAAALIVEGLLATGRRLAGSTAARIGLGERFTAGVLGSRQSRRLLGVLRLEGEARFAKLAGRFISKEISLKGWADTFKGGVGRLVAAGFHAIYGGKPLGPAQVEAYRVALRRQGSFLDRFRAAVATGDQPLDGTLVGRARLYGAAAWGAAVNGQRQAAGHAEEKRVTGPTDHCNGCLSESNKGWQPAGTLLGIGETVCKARCACHFVYRGTGPTLVPSPGLFRAAPIAPVQTSRAPRKAKTKPVPKADAPGVTLSLDEARAVQRAANVEAARKGVIEAAPRIREIQADLSRVESELAAVRGAYDTKAVGDYQVVRRLVDRHAATIRDPAATKADRARAEDGLKHYAPRYEELKATVGTAGDRITALDGRRDALKVDLARLGRANATVPYAELLKANPDLIPPGPIADRLRAYVAGDAKVRELAKLTHAGEDITGQMARIAREQAGLSDEIAARVAARREILSPYPGRTPVPADVAARSRDIQAEIGGLAARRVALDADRHAISVGDVTSATREAALRILGMEPGRSLSVTATPVPAGFAGSEGVLEPLDAATAQARSAAESWLARATVRGDHVAVATRVGSLAAGRPNFTPRLDYMQLAPGVTPDVVVHEYGHVLDERLTTGGVKVLDRSREFLAHRVGDEAPVSLRAKFGRGFDTTEMGRKDRFEDGTGGETTAYYAGKDYGEHATEVLSMGVELLYRDPAGFAARDPEWAKFAIGVLDSSLR